MVGYFRLSKGGYVNELLPYQYYRDRQLSCAKINLMAFQRKPIAHTIQQRREQDDNAASNS